MGEQIKHDPQGLAKAIPQFDTFAETWRQLQETLGTGAEMVASMRVRDPKDELSKQVVKQASGTMDAVSQIMSSLTSELENVGLRVNGVKQVRDSAGEQAEGSASWNGNGRH